MAIPYRGRSQSGAFRNITNLEKEKRRAGERIDSITAGRLGIVATIKSLNGRQHQTDAVATQLVLGFKEALKDIPSTQHQMSLQSDLAMQGVAMAYSDIRTAESESLSRDQALLQATQNALRETETRTHRQRMGHSVESQSSMGSDERGRKYRIRRETPQDAEIPACVTTTGGEGGMAGHRQWLPQEGAQPAMETVPIVIGKPPEYQTDKYDLYKRNCCGGEISTWA